MSTFTSSRTTRDAVRRAKRARRALTFALVMLALGTTGCTHVKPWERGKLAHPTMVQSSFAGAAEEHVYAVQEGAAGGGAAAESGCGCN